MQSYIEKKFNEFLLDEKIELVSFDIFETLAFRKVSKPIDIFYKIGENEYVKDIFQNSGAFQQLRINAEKTARKNCVNEEITLEEIYNQLPLTKSQKKRIIKIEIDIENDNLYINKAVESWMYQAYNSGKKVILISDMYLSYKQIEKIVLKKLKRKEIIDNIYISSEYKKTKAKSSMYEFIKEECSLNFNKWLHIGDNYRADYINSMQLGINALYYNVDSYVQEVFKLEDAYISNCNNSIRNLRLLSSMNNTYEEDKHKFFFNLGAIIFGPLLWEFSHWIKELCKKHEINQVNFVMREGFVFEKYFKLLFPKIETNLVYASRKSTYLPIQDLNDFNLNNLDFFTYRDFTLEDFYLLYCLEIDNDIINQHRHIQYKEANNFLVDGKPILELFMEDIKLKENLIKTNITKQKKFLVEYIKQLKVKSNSILIDLGGGGTVLKRFDKILNNKIKVNGLFYIHGNGYEKQLSKTTFSFLPYENSTKYAIELIRRSPEFIEFLLNGIEKTTLSYTKDKIIEPVTKYPYEQIVDNKDIIGAFQNGIDSYFNIMKEYKNKSDSEIRNFLVLLLARVIDVPLEKEVYYLGNLFNDEGAGSSFIKKIVNDESINSVKELGVEHSYRNFLKNIRYKRDEIHWLQGTITHLDKDFIKDMKGISSTNVNQNAIDYFLNILDRNSHINKVNIYGAGELSELLITYLNSRNIEIVSVMDTRAEMKSFYFKDFFVEALDKSINEKNEYPIIIASIAFCDEITRKIINFSKDNGFCLSIINYKNGLFKTL